jgi:hypothetical protein
MPATIAPPLLAHEQSDGPARRSLTHFLQRSAFRAIYALADLASGRAVFDSQFLRNSSRCLST